jgi:hypothetical protein
MKTERKHLTAGGIGAEAVKAKTGRGWNEWFAILDKAGAKKLNHKEIVGIINLKYDVSPWWKQMITVAYEQERGLREKHQKIDGFQISKSKTVDKPLPVLYKTCFDEKLRKLWLPQSKITIRKSSENKSIRMTWIDGKTIVEFQFYDKDTGKSQITVQHSKLSNKTEAARSKKFWSESLERLKSMLKA